MNDELPPDWASEGYDPEAEENVSQYIRPLEEELAPIRRAQAEERTLFSMIPGLTSTSDDADRFSMDDEDRFPLEFERAAGRAPAPAPRSAPRPVAQQSSAPRPPADLTGQRKPEAPGMMSRIFSGQDFQSNSRPVIENGQVNWGDPQNPADFMRANAAMTQILAGQQGGTSSAPARVRPNERVTPPRDIPSDGPLKQVDPRLRHVLNEARTALPNGYAMQFTSGFREKGVGFHPKGKAVDVILIDPEGRRLANYQDPRYFDVYESFAKAVRQKQQELYPELEKSLRWGGYFSGGKGKYGAFDLMHFDLGGDRVPTGGGSWESGLTPEQRRIWGIPARAEGGRVELLQDEYPTQYLPNVGRQVMEDGGVPEDDYAMRLAREIMTTDPMGSPTMAGTMDQPEEARTGAYETVTDFLSAPFRTYADKTKEAIKGGSNLMSESAKSLKGEEGRLPINALWQYPLGAAATVLSPLTGVTETLGEGAAQLTGNKQIGERAAGVLGLIDPSHAGAFGKMAPYAAMAVPAAAKAADAAQAVSLAKRELSPLGLYSYGEEVAKSLPQARGTPEQFAAMLAKQGVKPVELEGFQSTFAGKPQVTREEAASFFKDGLPQIERKVLGQQANSYPYSTADEWQNAINQAERRRDFDESQRLTLAWEEAEGLGGQGAPKFQKYTLPGGENYREVLLKLPAEEKSIPQFKVIREDGVVDSTYVHAEGAQARAQTIGGTVREDSPQAVRGGFRSSHWQDDPNVLVHTRMADRTGPNNEKILHVEEIQSDWGQKGKKEGFKQTLDPKIVEQAQEKLDDAGNALRNHLSSIGLNDIEMGNALADARSGRIPSWVLGDPRNEHFGTDYIDAMRNRNSLIQTDKPPSAPYVTNTAAWTDLALKDILHEAAKGGYDKVVWTPGVEQAKRYKLSNSVQDVTLHGTGDNMRLSATAANGDHRVIDMQHVTPATLPNYVGREVAEKLLALPEPKANNPYAARTLTGLDLDVGGEGMKTYYDKIVPNQLRKLVKKLDPEAKLEMSRLPVQNYTISAPDIARELGMTVDEIAALPHAEKMELVSRVRHSIAAPSLTITPKMRENILRGQTAYARGGVARSNPPANPALNRALELTRDFASDIG